ncbi:MAG: choice-of-anchor K domain-containing protein [Phycisphaerae bacterium]
MTRSTGRCSVYAWVLLCTAALLTVAAGVQANGVGFAFTDFEGLVRRDRDYEPDPAYDGAYILKVNGTEVTNLTEILSTYQEYSYTYTEWWGNHVLSGENVQSVEFHWSYADYDAESNELSFVPAGSVVPDSDGLFKLGTLTFLNGTYLPSKRGSQIGFTISAEAPDGELHSFEGTFVLETNSDDVEINPTPEERADYLYVEEDPALGSLRVFDASDGNNTGSAEIWGRFGSLDLVEFRNPTGGAFISPSVTPQPAAIPEPLTMLGLTSGLLTAGWAARRRRR